MKEAEMKWEEFPEAQEWESNRWTWRRKSLEDAKPPDIELSAGSEWDRGREPASE